VSTAPDDDRRTNWSHVAKDLHFSTLPAWLKLTAAHRWRAIDVAKLEGWTWHTWYRIALDYSQLDIVPRSVARVLCDWHGTDATWIAPMSRDIALRVPTHPDHALRAVQILAETGWAAITSRPGQPSRVVLTVPVDEPPTPAPRAGVTPAPRAGPPAPRAGDPRATRGTQGNRGKGAISGAARVSKSDAVPRGGVGVPLFGIDPDGERLRASLERQVAAERAELEARDAQ
jgi:hypothetical protein